MVMRLRIQCNKHAQTGSERTASGSSESHARQPDSENKFWRFTISQNLHAVWPRLRSTDKLHVANQIKQHLDEIRPLSQSGVDQEFNQSLVSRFTFTGMESSDEGRAELEGLKSDVLATPCRQVVFTHSDSIAARNILVNNRNNAFLDREVDRVDAGTMGV